jgi:hypothetical protein
MFNVYRKPTATDITIPNEPCNPQKKAVKIKYRLSTYRKNEREKEEKMTK